jgi:hypothetical protein
MGLVSCSPRLIDTGNPTNQRLRGGVIRAAPSSTVFRWKKAPVSTDHLKPVSRHLDFAEQRAESYNQIVSEVRIKGRSSQRYPWEQD